MNSTPHILVGLLFIVIGNYLPQCKPNYFVGIKTPWTLSNEEVWRKTHRFSGKVFVVLGVIMILSIFCPRSVERFPNHWNYCRGSRINDGIFLCCL